MPKPTYAILPAADGQQAVTTTHAAIFQDAINGGANVVEEWFRSPSESSLLELLQHWLDRVPGSARQAFIDAFVLRLEQRLRAVHAFGLILPPADEPDAPTPLSSDAEGSCDA